MGKLHDLLIETVVAEAVACGDTELDQDVLVKRMSEIAPILAQSGVKSYLDSIKKDAKVGISQSRRERRGFERRLSKHWAKPLHLLELTVEIAQEVAGEVGETVAAEEVKVDEHTFRALWAIHARGCQMSRAILALLRSGFADDAHARWRSLHELAAVSSFISKHGDGVAEKYLLHDVVQRRKLARAYKEHEVRAKLDPLTQAEMDDIEGEYQSLIGKFGNEFAEDYGWAASALGNKRPTLLNIEEDVGLDHLRPYYQMANHNVHGNSHAAFFKLGVFEPDRPIHLAGPSNMGLADPGHGVALSLVHITGALAQTVPTLDTLTEWMVLDLLQHETGDAFLQAHKESEKIAQDKLRRRSADGGIVKHPRWGSKLVSRVA